MAKSPAPNILICSFFFLIAVLSLPVDQTLATDTRPDSWAFLGGYGQSYPGWGQTTQRVETIDLILRYNHIVFDEIGSGWYKGFHSTLFEFPVSLILNPEISTMIGINFLAAYTFTVNEQWQPYIFGGGGPVYIFADIPGMGTKLNGNYQFGIGLEYFLNKQNHLLFEYRYHHISNAGTAKPNEPLNSSKFIVGITF
jgi:lipid A 3-O-deacylase